MATYNSLTDRDEVSALIPEDVASEIIQVATESSAVMRMGRELPRMSRKQRRLPVLGSLPHAYFVNGDTGLKQTSEVSWENVYVNAEELAVIVPIPEAVLDDADYDIIGETKPLIAQAMGAKFDQAVFYGIDAPSLWPTPIELAARAAGHNVVRGEIGDTYDDLLAEGGVLNLVEEDGFGVTGHVAALRTKAILRGLRDDNGQPLFNRDMQAAGGYSLDGEQLFFPKNGSIDPRRSLLISGDWSQLVFAIRQDITYKVLDQAVITDGSGAIVYNLAQQDMVALRVVMRLGWALPNPITPLNTTDATRYPFATYEPVAAS